MSHFDLMTCFFLNLLFNVFYVLFVVITYFYVSFLDVMTYFLDIKMYFLMSLCTFCKHDVPLDAMTFILA